MLKKVSQETVELIKEKILNAKIVELPITGENVQIIYEWFEDEEISLANAEADGEEVDQAYFDLICRVVDELFIGDGKALNLADLNKRLDN